MKERDSYMELLRIVSILFVTIHHFLTHGAYPAIFEECLPISTADSVALMLNGFVFIGVNCFILISGYFGIQFKAKSLVQLILVCVFYSVFGYLLHLGIDHQTFGRSVLDSIFFLKYSNWWFVKCYIGLWLLAPILNKAVGGFSRREYQIALVFMTIANVYLGNLRQVEFYDMNGFSIMHFVYLYMIGGYIKYHMDVNILTKYRNYLWLIYVFCALLWGGLSIADHNYSISIWHILTYNNFVLLMASVAFFSAFTTIKIQSKTINYIAKSAFPVYLVQEHTYLYTPLYGAIRRMCALLASPSSSCGVVVSIILAIVFFILVFAFDQLRVLLFTNFNKYKKQ